MYSLRPKNRSHGNNRNHSAQRYNTPGTFVPSEQPLQTTMQQFNAQSEQVWSQLAIQSPQPKISVPENNVTLTSVVMNNESIADTSYNSNDSVHKKWIKKGFKISMKEKRRRQNITLRRLITPKNALMVLNELAAGSQQECTVVPDETFGGNPVNRQYVAILNIGGVEYSGKGSTKLMAKNMAAEYIIRDMIIKQMSHLPTVDPSQSMKPEEKMDIDDKEDKSFPMIQLASYALHKLFTEWQTEGYKVPLLNQNKCESPLPSGNSSTTGVIQPAKPKKTPTLPSNPELLHPCTLLSQMHGALEYTLLAQEGTPPNGQIFTMGVNIDGKTYAGKATNKKEARKQAAKAACQDLYNIVYVEGN